MNEIIKTNNTIELLNNVYGSFNINTKKAYITGINQFMDFMNIGLNQLSGVNPKDILNYIENLKGKYKNSTINLKLSALKGLYKKISIINNIVNPFDFIDKMNINVNQKTDIQFNKELSLSGQDVKALLKHYQQKSKSNNSKTRFTALRNHCLISMLYYTGIRISEALNIKLSDIEPVNDDLYIIRIIGKGNKPRSIKIDNELFNQISLIKSGENDYIFRGLNNSQLSRIAISQDIKRLAKRIINKDIHLHLFRHTFATKMIELTKDIAKVSKYLGHSDISITSKIYYHNELSINELNLLKAV